MATLISRFCLSAPTAFKRLVTGKKSLFLYLTALILVGSSAKVMAAGAATLTGLTLSAGTLSPAFFSNTFGYTSSENSSTASITVTPTSGTLGALITVNGIITLNGIASSPIALSAGSNTITIVVSAVGFTTKIYTITVTRQNISYIGSPFTYYTGLGTTALTPAITGAPTSYAISPAISTGLSFSTITGVVSGTPTVAAVATTYTITANYAGGITATTTINITVLASTISYAGSPFTFYQGTAIATASSTEVGGNPTTYSGVLPAGLLLNTSTGDITGTPTTASSSTPYTITANYGSGVTATTVINITVLAPTISYAGNPFTFFTTVAITALNPTTTGSPVSFSGALPAGLSLNTTNGQITGTPTTVVVATPYTITANYAGGVTATTILTITVKVGLPVISYSPSTNTYTAGTAIATLTPTSTGGTVASYSVSPGLPAGLSINAITGVISGTPTAASSATTYTITATNTTGTATTTVNLTVLPQPPVISYSPGSEVYPEGSAIAGITPINTGGAATSFSISTALPTGLTFNTVTGKISGTPTVPSTITTYTITATNAGGSGTTTLTLTVTPYAPVISYSPSTSVFTVGSAITSLTPTNTGGADTIYVVGPSLPPGLSFNSYTGVISGTPTALSAATTYIISGTNDGGSSTTTVTLSCINPPVPTISYSPSTNTYLAGTAITPLSPTTSGSPTSFSISTALPSGLSFSSTTGIISGTATVVSATTTYTITATNAAGSGTTTITLTVNPPAPIISYSPSINTYTKGTAITPLTPANIGGAAVSYSISAALPAGLSFSTTTGVISGTPTAVSALTTYTITATNASGSGTTTVKITVNSLAPAITYSPGTVSYSVGSTITPATPTNTGGAASSYAISGGTLPTGLSFNTSTGVVSGTPTVVFPTTTFTITATNSTGTSSTSLIITVSPAAPIISYTPSTNVYSVGGTIPTLTPTNTGGSTTGYSYSTTGTTLNGATLSGPSLMTIDASGNIYVANWNNGTISEWNSSHTYLGKFGTGITMSNPEGIVFDSSGNAYVEDTGTGDVYKFNSAGVYQSTVITGLNHPLGISINSSNQLFIATYVYTSPYTSSVNEYSTSGTLLLSLPNTNMNESDGVAVNQSSGVVYVLNRGNNLTGSNMGNVTYYSAAGAYLGVFSSGYSDPLAISVDASGDVFVADSHNNEVKIYSSTGVLLNTLTGFTDVEGFVADANGNLYVSDYTDNTVKEFASLGGYHISAPLPPGLTFNSSTGQISGTPTTLFAATTYTITAYNITGSGTTTVTLSCVDAFDWVGVTSTDWKTASNWLSGVVPTSTSQAVIGVNRTFNYFPTILTADGTVNVGSIAFGNLGGQSPGVAVNSGATLNVSGAITYQSDADAGLGYTCTLSGAGTLNTNSIAVIANTSLGSSYTATMASSVTNLNITTDIALTSSNTGAALFNSTFNITGGTTLLTGTLQTTNTSTSTSSLVVIPATTATLQLANATALSGLSSIGTNNVTFDNTGATVEYSGAAQTIYANSGVTGLTAGVSYQNIAFSGTGIKTVLSGNLNIAGDFTNSMANDASDYVNFVNPTVSFNGTIQNLAGGAGTGTKFYKVAFSGAGKKTMNSGLFYVAPSGVLAMIGTNALTILNANGLLTLNSSSVASATVAAMSAGPSITGNVNVERYVTGGSGYRGYRLASSPVYSGTVSSKNVCSINYLQSSMYLTGNSGGGFDKTGNPTLYLFREDLTPSNATFTSGNFWGISAINNSPTYNYYLNGGSTSYNIPVGGGFMFFFRGNRASAAMATETQASYTSPVAVTMSATGTLNQGQIAASDWYTPTSSYLGYTGTGTGTNYAVRGFNLVGNPYASSIDWEQFNTTSSTTGIYGSNIGTTIYELDPSTNNYDVYQKGGVYTNHGGRTVVSGQGFFILATGTNPQLIFNESAKSYAQNTGLNLFMATSSNIVALNNPTVDSHLRLQLSMDTVNTDDIYIGFNSAASTKYVNDEDAPYKTGNGKVKMASISSDNIKLAINRMPLPGLKPATIPLFVTAAAYGTYSLNMTELEAIPQIYQVWLMDRFNKDSLDMRHNNTYAFDITADTNSYGNNRFQLVIRQDLALAVHLLDFTASKVSNGAETVWKTENEQNYTNFTVERSTDNGATFTVLSGFASTALGTYSLLDKDPAQGTDEYRLKLEDLNGNITYSNIVTLVYGNGNISLAKNDIVIYPNPAKSTLNLNITPAFKTATTAVQSLNPVIPALASTGSNAYNIKIVNSLGEVIKTATTTDQTWQTDVSGLLPGTYILQVINNSNSSVVGKGTFIKL